MQCSSGDKAARPQHKIPINGTKLAKEDQISFSRGISLLSPAQLYTYDQAAAFPSLQAILGTLPVKQPRRKKGKAGLKGGADHQAATPHEQIQVPSSAAADETVLDKFIRMGIEIRDTLGDEALDQAVEQIKAHAPETFEDVFAEV